MRDFGSFGSGLNFVQYRGIQGPLKALHPGSKLLTLAAGIVTITLTGSISALLLLVLAIFCAAARAGIPPRSMLKPIAPVAPFLALVLLIHGLTLPREAGEWLLSVGDILPMTLMAMRILALMTLLGLLSAILTTSQISYGVEALLSPLSRIGIPAGELGLIATVTFRFIPFLREESERLAKAQTARGGSLGYRSSNPFRRIRASIPVMIPLFIGTLRKAEILAESMHLRGYSESRYRIRLHRYELTPRDFLWLLTSAALIAAAAAMTILDTDSFLIDYFRRILS